MSCRSWSAPVVQGEPSSFVPWGSNGAGRVGSEIDFEMSRPMGFFRESDLGVARMVEVVEDKEGVKDGIDWGEVLDLGMGTGVSFMMIQEYL